MPALLADGRLYDLLGLCSNSTTACIACRAPCLS